MKINFVNNVCNQNFNGRAVANTKYKKMVLESELDSFVSSIIEKERKNTGIIYNYNAELPMQKLKNFTKGIKDYVEAFILNDKVHIIKLDKNNQFLDIAQKIINL